MRDVEIIEVGEVRTPTMRSPNLKRRRQFNFPRNVRSTRTEPVFGAFVLMLRKGAVYLAITMLLLVGSLLILTGIRAVRPNELVERPSARNSLPQFGPQIHHNIESSMNNNNSPIPSRSIPHTDILAADANKAPLPPVNTRHSTQQHAKVEEEMELEGLDGIEAEIAPFDTRFHGLQSAAPVDSVNITTLSLLLYNSVSDYRITALGTFPCMVTSSWMGRFLDYANANLVTGFRHDCIDETAADSKVSRSRLTIAVVRSAYSQIGEANGMESNVIRERVVAALSGEAGAGGDAPDGMFSQRVILLWMPSLKVFRSFVRAGRARFYLLVVERDVVSAMTSYEFISTIHVWHNIQVPGSTEAPRAAILVEASIRSVAE
mmetsp:Transcript_11616/g.21024  ORF Transcript_11616/g.21024 Transcript_11616/m.21024 type:complete len:376 (+) Transcript_11616:184-1311(+)